MKLNEYEKLMSEAGDKLVAAQEEIKHLRGALAWIYNSTEPDAIKHMDYDHLASNVSQLAKSALDGEFYDDMQAAATYDRQKAAANTPAVGKSEA